MIKEIRHFEIVGDIERFKDEWFRQDQGPIMKVSHRDLIKTYLLPNLGRELKRKETRKVPCARIYYDENDKMAGINIYYQEDLLCSFKYYHGLPIKKEDNEIRENQKLLNTNRFLSERFDVKSVLLQTSGRLVKLKEKSSLDRDRIRVFSKVPVLPFDIYMLDLEENFRDMEYFCKPEYVLYEAGYKEIEEKYIDIDRLAVQKIRMIYDEEGFLIRKDIFIETPWGEFINRKTTKWFYNLKNHLIFCKEFWHRKTEKFEGSEYIGYYELDERNCLLQHRLYERSSGDDIEEITDEHTPEGMVPFWKVYYKSDDAGRIIEYTVENLDEVSHLFIALKKTFEYDSQGRFYRVKAYNEDDKIVSITTYKYPNQRQVERICWCAEDDVPFVEKISAISQCIKEDELTGI